jgi:3-mercaptopropionate dioxygenase
MSSVAPDIDKIAPLRDFVVRMTRLIERSSEEAVILSEGRKLLSQLISDDDWLPDEFARPHPQFYQQYLLYCDPFERFSVVSFVWGPGQYTPIHNHTVWGLVGVLRGAEASTRYKRNASGRLTAAGKETTMYVGDVDAVSPTVGDIHTVSNAIPDRPSISIHVYGANIGAVGREVFEPKNGTAKPFVSGYSSTLVPNLWDRSAQISASLRR